MREASRSIPPLFSGGIMLSYRCSSRCRHCLYRCSPEHPDEWMTPETLQQLIQSLKKEPSLHGVHLAGGEPTLNMDLLLRVVQELKSHGIPIDYLETNAGWCRDPARTRERMTMLRDAGLPGLLVSASMFHNEFIPFVCTRHAVEVGREVFGQDAVIVYLPHLYDMLARLPPVDTPHTVESFSEHFGIAGSPEQLSQLYDVIPGGRATDALRNSFQRQHAEAFRNLSCQHPLTSTTHFHIDHYGNLFTGLCAGIAPARVDNLHPVINESTHPIFCRLAAQGPCGLLDMATGCGFQHRPDGYVSKCDLCFRLRKSLAATGQFSELRPASFYRFS